MRKSLQGIVGITAFGTHNLSDNDSKQSKCDLNNRPPQSV
ncbi:hypothetical protein DOY81_011899 [Sarcophaga bullata]|nr:hypothetical protein DOY81_011899 [Sarcophaga bullata]